MLLIGRHGNRTKLQTNVGDAETLSRSSSANTTVEGELFPPLPPYPRLTLEFDDRCGLVCCASCTTHKDAIDPYLVVREPGIPPTLEDLQPWSLSTPLLYRTCDSCHAALALPQGLSHLSSSLLSPQSFFPPSPSLGSITPSETNESEASELTECPVCGQTLNDFGERTVQEDHVRNCLEKGAGSISSGRYLGASRYFLRLPNTEPSDPHSLHSSTWTARRRRMSYLLQRVRGQR